MHYRAISYINLLKTYHDAILAQFMVHHATDSNRTIRVECLRCHNICQIFKCRFAVGQLLVYCRPTVYRQTFKGAVLHFLLIIGLLPMPRGFLLKLQWLLQLWKKLEIKRIICLYISLSIFFFFGGYQKPRVCWFPLEKTTTIINSFILLTLVCCTSRPAHQSYLSHCRHLPVEKCYKLHLRTVPTN